MPKVKRARYETQDKVDTILKQFNANIYAICRHRKKSLYKMAEEASISKSTWDERARNPSSYKFREVIKISLILEVPLESLLFGKWDIKDTKAG